MSITSKTKYILITILLSFVVLIPLVFYLALRNKSKDVSEKSPYVAVLNREIVTINEAIYIDNSTLTLTTEYPNELQDFESIDTSRVKYTNIPKGSVLQFYKAVQVNRAVSGNQYVFLLGEVILKDTNIKTPIIYHWGTFKTICIDKPCNYWEHKKAPWQSEIDTKKYFD